MDWTCFGAAMTGAGAYFVCDMVWHWLLITGRRRPARWESAPACWTKNLRHNSPPPPSATNAE
jgi:hypothetical protein